MEEYPLHEETNIKHHDPGDTIRKLGEVAIAGYVAGDGQRKLRPTLRWWQKLAAFLKRTLKRG